MVYNQFVDAMKIAHVLQKYEPLEWGGTETALVQAIKGMNDLGVKSVTFCPQRRYNDKFATRDPIQEAGCPVKRFKAFLPVWGINDQQRARLEAIGGNLMSLELPFQLWHERDLSLIHAHVLGRLGGIARMLSRARGIPLVVTIHGGVLSFPRQVTELLIAPLRGGWEWGKALGWMVGSRRILAEADAIITVNEQEAALLKKRYPNQRICFIPPGGVRVADYQVDHREATYRAYPRLRNRAFLLTVARIDRIKNQAWLIQQAPKLFRRHPKLMLVLAGPTTDLAYAESLNREIRRLNLTERVILTGCLPLEDPRLVGLYQAASALILTSLAEPFGLVVLEAWASGTVVISSRTAGPTQLIRHGKNGWLFDLDKPETFHTVIKRTLSENGVAKQLAVAALRYAEASFDVSKTMRVVKDLYDELLNQKQDSRTKRRRSLLYIRGPFNHAVPQRTVFCGCKPDAAEKQTYHNEDSVRN